ncbi:Glu-tRNA(Gln) amidotransferase subunit GatE [Candidatus Micrarchaeota archaeon]|nr:Glu-tRNA(Gln) amidotransferase subunit GatE [Candidatus Micrarchaeota archaeon]
MDYSTIGFKAGIEIHQRLDVGSKLFCNCPCAVGEEKPKSVLRRRLRAVPGELGIVDPAAAFEVAKGKTYVYETFRGSSCNVEEDEEPPLELNQKALDAALQVCNALNASVLDEVHVMRKTVADGSAVSAFQRTALVGVNGSLKTSKGNVAIETVCLEEESAGIVAREEKETTYRLDRLGVPLVEIATAPSLKDPEHVKEAAEAIGLLLRSSEHVRRGIGTIRQDLNVSIEGGTRVEIKGAQQLEDLPFLVENEVLRQQNLLAISAELKKRGFKRVAFGKPHGVSHIFAKAKPFLSDQLKQGKMAMAIKLLFCKALLGREIMPAHRFGTELADYAKSKGVKGIIHCDEDPAKYGLTENDFLEVSTELDCIEDDGWAVVVADESVALSALRAVFDRAFSEALPKETRRAEGRISRFMRPLPGAARMYPETDVLPVVVGQSRVAKAGKLESFEERKAGLLQKGLNEELAEKILRSPDARLFEQLSVSKVPLKTVAWLVTDVKQALKREGFEQLRLEEALKLLEQEKITKAAVQDLLRLGANETGVSLEKLAEAGNLSRIKGEQLKQLAASVQGGFGEIMKRYRFQVEPRELSAMLGKEGGRGGLSAKGERFPPGA